MTSTEPQICCEVLFRSEVPAPRKPLRHKLQCFPSNSVVRSLKLMLTSKSIKPGQLLHSPSPLSFKAINGHANNLPARRIASTSLNPNEDCHSSGQGSTSGSQSGQMGGRREEEQGMRYPLEMRSDLPMNFSSTLERIVQQLDVLTQVSPLTLNPNLAALAKPLHFNPIWQP